MVFYTEWIDFVRYTGAPQKIKSIHDRLDIANAVDITDENVKKYGGKGKGYIIKREDILYEKGDDFECIYISEFGQIYIWTKFRLWTLLPEESDKMIFLNRHPEVHFKDNKESGRTDSLVSEKWTDFAIFPKDENCADFLFSKERFEKNDCEPAKRNIIKKFIFSEYPLPTDSDRHIDQFYKPDVPCKLLITEKEFMEKEDLLEMMIFNIVDMPIIWTRKFVCAMRCYDYSEKLILLPRHPAIVCNNI